MPESTTRTEKLHALRETFPKISGPLPDGWLYVDDAGTYEHVDSIQDYSEDHEWPVALFVGPDVYEISINWDSYEEAYKVALDQDALDIHAVEYDTAEKALAAAHGFMAFFEEFHQHVESQNPDNFDEGYEAGRLETKDEILQVIEHV